MMNMSTIMKNKILIIPITWLGLGFKRGLDDYNYTVNQRNKLYMYSDAFMFGLLGVIVYINPILVPLNVIKEIYRVEVNLRGLEEEKKKDKYNVLF